MELTTAIELIRLGTPDLEVQTWADLGAGSGLFTRALSTLVGKGSSIVAVDQSVSKIKLPNADISLVEVEDDFINYLKKNKKAHDGILMANSLHYVKNKESFFESLKVGLKENGRVIIVEYDTSQSNQWVPYPIMFNSLIDIVQQCGFNYSKKIGEAPSQYHRGGMYSVLIKL